MATKFDVPEDDTPILDINTTPLIDVMLVLLIMLIITIPLQTHAVKLDLPVQTSDLPPVPPQTVSVDLAADGTVLWNGELLLDRDQLIQRLMAQASLPVQPELHVRPHPDAPYASVAMVLAATQRAGITKLGIVSTGEDVDF